MAHSTSQRKRVLWELTLTFAETKIRNLNCHTRAAGYICLMNLRISVLGELTLPSVEVFEKENEYFELETIFYL